MFEQVKDFTLETLWPTRCAICDKPATLLCEQCTLSLPYLDYWRACPVCGAHAGALQCCECNTYTLPDPTQNALASSTSSVLFTETSARIVRTYKDHGEQRLAGVMAQIMARSLPPELLNTLDSLTYIPASQKAYLKRGFDHAELLAKHISHLLHIPLIACFERPETKDQRSLGKTERLHNTEEAFSLRAGCTIEQKTLLLIDDVRTTGATLQGAASTLLHAHAAKVHALTFARVP